MKHQNFTIKKTWFMATVLLAALAFCSVAPAANIIFVTNDSSETGSLPLQDFLTSEGHTLTVGAFGTIPDAATLAANDLIIVARETNSGDYDDGTEPVDWNAITLPIINMSAFIERSSRWGYVSGTALNASDAITADGFDDPYLVPGHPYLAGVSSTTMLTAAARWDSPNTSNSIPAGSTYIASVSAGTGYGIVDIPAGAESFGHGTFGGPRVILSLGGTWTSITAGGERIMRNIIGFFTTTNKVKNPSPGNSDTNVSVNTFLNWEAPDDPNDEVVTYDVYFGTTVPDANCDGPPLVSGDQPGTSYDPGTLLFDTEYHWRVDVIDPNGGGNPIVVKGDCWSFTTAPSTPVILSNPTGLTVDAGTTAQFTVSQINGATFTWKQNGFTLSNGGKVSGADTDTLVITDVQLAEEGNYSVEVANANGSVETPAVQLLTCRLIAHWPLDGDLVDVVGGFNGTVAASSDSPAMFTTGIDGQAYDFTGDPNNNYVVITVGSDPIAFFNFYTRGFTVSAWVLDGTETAAREGIVSKQHPDEATGWTLDASPGDPDLRIRDTGVAVASGISLYTDPNWHLVVAVYEPAAGQARIYQDGLLAGTDSTIGAAPVPTLGAVVFGAQAYDGQDPYDGKLDDVRIYSCPLAPTEIATLYTNFVDTTLCVFDDPAEDISAFDHNDDCVVNILDFAEYAARFLDHNCIPAVDCE